MLMMTIQGWFNAHQMIAGSLIFPGISMMLNFMLKPRTPEQYAAMPPRLAAVLKALAALGVDPYKAAGAIRQILSGSAAPVLAMRRFGSDSNVPVKIDATEIQ